MTLLTKMRGIFSIIIFLQLFSIKALAQDLYDQPHSINYAHHLFVTKQYEPAANEYKRIALFIPNNDTIIEKVLLSYRMGGLYDSGTTYFKLHYSKRLNSPSFLNEEYAKNLILDENYRAVDSLLWSNNLSTSNSRLDSNFKNRLFFYNNVLMNNWIEARKSFYDKSLVLNKNIEEWNRLLQKQQSLKYKSPGLAMALSVVLPGSGKIYTNEWKDGLLSTLTIGTMAYESYVGFHARGTKSVLGWVFGGLAVGFYSGNIYGAYKSAQRYNIRKNNEIHDEAKKLVAADL